MRHSDKAVTYGELARRFGISHQAVARYARNLIYSRPAEAFMEPRLGAIDGPTSRSGASQSGS